MTKEALTLAIDVAINAMKDATKSIDKLSAENRTLKEALAQPEQEPVAWMDIDEKGAAYGLRFWHEPENRHEVPLYTTPPQRTWVGLTDDEMHECAGEYPWTPTGLKCCRAIEAKLRTKNGY